MVSLFTGLPLITFYLTLYATDAYVRSCDRTVVAGAKLPRRCGRGASSEEQLADVQSTIAAKLAARPESVNVLLSEAFLSSLPPPVHHSINHYVHPFLSTWM